MPAVGRKLPTAGIALTAIIVVIAAMVTATVVIITSENAVTATEY